MIELEHIPPCRLPTDWAQFQMHGFADPNDPDGREHVALTLGDVADDDPPPLVRLHSECLTGDALFSLRCDCGAQLEAALRCIAAEGRGVLLYLRQEGRGIGLHNKIRAYRLQDAGADTVDANLRLGLPADARRYDIAAAMLVQLGVRAVRLLTNNPTKLEALAEHGIAVVERVAIEAGRNPYNTGYLDVKARRMGHRLGFDALDE